MADPELEALRAKRLAQLQSERGIQGGDGIANQKVAEDRKREMEEMKHSILSQVLDQSARARLNTLMLGKPEKGRMVENMLLQMAQRGQIMGRLGENELIGILEQVSGQTQSKTTVKFDRRRAALDDSDDDL
ncbi:programmed cell death protein 5 [Homalodisca vitripennis]|uniref:Programmed cell death protein 5 n=1 Tax=Cuerna arida TaxID=1464854 RepID=A0A1B6F8Y9_9HEMI|nr:programmed cell death protein 5 [Homalodisca vitripennis]KAG8247231.1 Programmed cell death protein 5 [Homalodisca vitripennis]